MNKKIQLCILVAIAMVAGESAFAKDRAGKWGVGLEAGASVPFAPGVFRGMADVGVAAGAHVRYHLDPTWGLALSYDHLHFTNTSLSGDAVNANLFARLGGSKDLTPWVSVGLGPDHLSNYTAGSYWRFGMKAELGLEHDCTDQLSFGAKIAYLFVTKNQDALHDLAPSLVATWYFGGKHAVAETPAPAPEPKRAEAPAPTSTFTQEIAAKGGVKLNVEFDTGKATLRPGSSDEIAKVADYMKQETGAKITLEGYTDSLGNAKRNQALSQERAEAVRAELINKFGIDGSRLKAVGYGPARPVASNKTKDGRARNRRVMATIEEK